MSKYYYLTWGSDSRTTPFAFSNEKTKNNILINELIGKNELPFDFEIKQVEEVTSGITVKNMVNKNNLFIDYLPNNYGWPLMSENMKLLIEKNLYELDYIDWISCKVLYKEQVKPYYILRFTKRMDVLNLERTIFVKDTDSIIKPVFDKQKINHYQIFHKPLPDNLYMITPGIYVNESLKNIISNAKLRGIKFEKVSIE